uniref:F-box domain-containing protein n=1 Tax=Plectus sambesii TaxID=2011161 RepID=A0A914XFS9_9BILA
MQLTMENNNTIFSSCLPSTSKEDIYCSAQIEQLPEDVWLKICEFLSLSDWCAIGSASRRLHEKMAVVWSEKKCAIIESDVPSLNSDAGPMKFAVAEDNLWPHKHFQLDSFLPPEALQEAYADLFRLLRRCEENLEQLCLLETPYKPYRLTIGRSIFRVFSQSIYDRLWLLNLTRTSFELDDLSMTHNAFPELRKLIVDDCCISLDRRQVLTMKPDRVLKSVLIDHKKKRKTMKQGSKLFLATVIEIFPDLLTVLCSLTEFQSTGCIMFMYGTEERNAKYEFKPRRRKQSCATVEYSLWNRCISTGGDVSD